MVQKLSGSISKYVQTSVNVKHECLVSLARAHRNLPGDHNSDVEKSVSSLIRSSEFMLSSELVFEGLNL